MATAAAAKERSWTTLVKYILNGRGSKSLYEIEYIGDVGNI